MGADLVKDGGVFSEDDAANCSVDAANSEDDLTFSGVNGAHCCWNQAQPSVSWDNEEFDCGSVALTVDGFIGKLTNYR